MFGRPGRAGQWECTEETLRRTSFAPSASLVCTLVNRGGNRRPFRPTKGGQGSFPFYGGTFARSYSVLRFSAHGGACMNRRVPNPPPANPRIAEIAVRASDYWVLTRVAPTR